MLALPWPLNECLDAVSEESLDGFTEPVVLDLRSLFSGLQSCYSDLLVVGNNHTHIVLEI